MFRKKETKRTQFTQIPRSSRNRDKSHCQNSAPVCVCVCVCVCVYIYIYIHICIYIAEGKEIIIQRPFANNSRIVNNRIPPGRCGEAQGLTPNAEYLLVRLCCSLFRNTSDFGRGGFLGLRMTRASSRMSSSRSLESLDTDNCLCTRS